MIRIRQDRGRLGNSLFRYLKAISLCLKYEDYHFVCGKEQTGISINHKNINIIDSITKRKKNIFLCDYFQDEIPHDMRENVLDYIRNNPEHHIFTDGNPIGKRGPYSYESKKYFLRDLVNNTDSFNKFYEHVIHLRLEDKIDLGIVMKPETVIKLISRILDEDKFDIEKSCIVVAPLKTETEKEYIEKIQKFFLDSCGKKIKIESNSVEEDFCILRNAKILVCSLSSLSWCAGILSENIEKCYFPDWKKGMPCFDHDSVTIRKPIPNTLKYTIT